MPSKKKRKVIKQNPRVGAPTKLTPKMRATLLQLARGGASKELAANVCEISKVTLYSWINRGRETEQKILLAEESGGEYTPTDDENQYYEFMNAYRKAEAECELADYVCIGNAAVTGDWRAAAWRLERRNPKRYGKQALEISGPNGGAIPMEINLSGLSEKELDELERLLLKAGAKAGASDEFVPAGTDTQGETTQG